MKILSNLPIEDLNKDNDYLGIIEKGDMIVSLLKSDAVDLSQIKMFALYGNWGSGKSTLMKYMKRQFDASDNKFKTFYFDAWQYENGRDLSYSLLEFMIDKGLDKTEKVATELLEAGRSVLMGFTKSASFSIPGIRFTPKELIDELQKESRKSFHRKIQKFKEEFRNLENRILSTDSEKYNIVFIDDLDRCEPDKVLDLLSEIKLFFNYGKRTVFFFGVDEKAVQMAIEQKYGETIKSSEYLEKVFDLNFYLREDLSTKKFINQHFPERIIENISLKASYRHHMYLFFKMIQLTNPRKLKKVVNAYVIYCEEIKRRGLMEYHQLIHNEKSEGSFLISIVTIYLVILRLFEPETFQDFGNYHRIMRSIDKIVDKSDSYSNHGALLITAKNASFHSSIHHFLNEKTEVVERSGRINEKRINTYEFKKFAIMFAPADLVSITLESIQSLNEFRKDLNVNKKGYAYGMMWYLYSRIHNTYKLEKDKESDIFPLQIKDYIKEIL